MNNMDSLSTYILKCYNILEKNQNNVNFVIIQICCSHFFKTRVKDIKQCAKNDFQINFYRKFMIKAINICDIEDFWRLFKYITILLISKYENNNVKETLDYFDLTTEEEYKETNTNVKSSKVDNIPQYKKSLFYKKAFDIYTNMSINQDKTEMENKLWNPPYYNLILKKYIPYMVLWTNVMGIKIDKSDNT